MQAGLPWSSVEAEARQAYGRLVALLAACSGDFAGAEDALGDALLAALERWPVDGTPANPQAWLLTVARRRGIDRARQRNRADAAQAELVRMQGEAEEAMNEERPFPDARLGLLLACAHPAVDAAARTPLMLQAVLGLTAERMACAFLTSPAAMTKRLVRAKAKITAAGVSFSLPGPEALSERVEPLLDAIYAAFTLARDDCGVAELEGEAVWLARLVAQLAPDQPEAEGLLSLMLFVTSRTPANGDGAFTPLSRQDPATWNVVQMAEAEECLRTAGRLGRAGRFQLEAAIQAVHADRRRSGRTDWAAILTLYEGLLEIAPTIGAQVARAAALAQSGDPAAALGALDTLEPGRVGAHQPYWATRAFALAALGNDAEASDAYLRAAGLTERPAVRAWLLEQRTALTS
jgi:RNA polymerase sigma-70 factor (ECF subfamily)